MTASIDYQTNTVFKCSLSVPYIHFLAVCIHVLAIVMHRNNVCASACIKLISIGLEGGVDSTPCS